MDFRHIISARCVLMYVKQEDNIERWTGLGQRQKQMLLLSDGAAFFRMTEALEQSGSGVLTNRPKL